MINFIKTLTITMDDGAMHTIDFKAAHIKPSWIDTNDNIVKITIIGKVNDGPAIVEALRPFVALKQMAEIVNSITV